MIEIKFTLDPEKGVYEQLVNYVAAFAPPQGVSEETEAVTRVTPSTPVEAEPVEPKKHRGRKPKQTSGAAEEEPTVDVPAVDAQDMADEAAEAASDKLTHDDVRAAVGDYTKQFGIVAAQKNIPQLLGGPIAEIPEDQAALAAAIQAVRQAMTPQETDEPTLALFDEPAAVKEITETDVREALMAYAAKYDGDAKMANTLVDGPDILKKTFGPTVSAMRLIPKDPASLRKAYDAIHDAITNNWYNRKAVQ